MDYEQLLNTTFQCQCGKTHTVPIRRIVYAEDALDAIPDTLAAFTPGRRVLILADQRTWSIAGEQASRLLRQAGWNVNHIILPDTDHGGSVCDDRTFDALNTQLPPADIMLAVGSGVINDLTKWLAFERGLPYAVLATAAPPNKSRIASNKPTPPTPTTKSNAPVPASKTPSPTCTKSASAHVTIGQN